MKINKLYIENAGPLENIEIVFDEPNINYFGNLKISVIVGENGVGKTTILKLIAYSFFNRLYEKDFSKDDNNYLEFNNNGKIAFAKHGSVYHKNKEDISPKKVIVSSFAVFEQFAINESGSLTRLGHIKNENQIKYSYCGPMSSFGRTSMKKNIEMILDAFYGDHDNNSSSKAIRELMSIINYSGYPILEIYKSLRWNDISTISEQDRQKLREDFEKLKIELRNIRIIDKEKYIIPSYNVNYKLLMDILRFEKSGQRIIRDLWFVKDNKYVSFSKLSSGEVTMFYRFFPLIQAVENDSIIIIDEPETHLHPKWIREYIYNLYKIFNEYNIHIIIASHSPMIVSDVPRECIIGLQNNCGEIKQFNVAERTMGGEPVSILQEVFHLNDYRGKFTGEKIDDIMWLVKNNKLERALQIYNDLGTTADKYNLFKEISKYLPTDKEV